MPLLYHHFTVIMPLLYHHYAVIIPSWYRRYTIIMPSLYHHYIVIIPSLCHHYTIIVPSLNHNFLYYLCSRLWDMMVTGGVSCFSLVQILFSMYTVVVYSCCVCISCLLDYAYTSCPITDPSKASICAVPPCARTWAAVVYVSLVMSCACLLVVLSNFVSKLLQLYI